MENSIEEDMKILEEFKTHGYAMLLIKYEDRNKTNLKLDQAIETVLSELEKKEAIINEMARYIDKITEEIAREKGVEDFEFCDNKCTDKDEYIDCKDCIKK